MSEDWALNEVEAVVADYFNMLDLELRGQDYNKAEHRRRLLSLLNHRSAAAVERKHQNISAVLHDLGFPYIFGYKPLRNYQQLLFDVVAARFQGSRSLRDFVLHQVEQPAGAPEMQNILSAWVEPPSELFADRGRNPPAFRQPAAAFNIDYFAMEAHNRSLGCEGEKFVVRFEQERLAHAGKDNLAARVEHYSLTHGDGAGFDVLSFETTGQERFIEVKTTAYGPLTPFFVTRNEVEASKRNAPGYYLYRNFNFRRQPKLFWKNGPLDRSFRLDPAEYQASLT